MLNVPFVGWPGDCPRRREAPATALELPPANAAKLIVLIRIYGNECPVHVLAIHLPPLPPIPASRRPASVGRGRHGRYVSISKRFFVFRDERRSSYHRMCAMEYTISRTSSTDILRSEEDVIPWNVFVRVWYSYDSGWMDVTSIPCGSMLASSMVVLVVSSYLLGISIC